MAVYVDEIFEANPLAFAETNPMARQAARHGTKWCHLWCHPDTPAEREKLHAIAEAIGLRRSYFQDRDGFPHYDLVPGKRRMALQSGAVFKDLREWIAEKRSGVAGVASEKTLKQASLF